jgi:hypothetical protein
LAVIGFSAALCWVEQWHRFRPEIPGSRKPG